MFAGKKSAQIREILISESAWEEMTCLFAPSLDEPVQELTDALDNLAPVNHSFRILKIGEYLSF
ncbi:hypothetical protein FHC21_17125 [Enterobacter roggenkampii]|nr:hypothetical protein [Enterobacter roggenkampii]